MSFDVEFGPEDHEQRDHRRRLMSEEVAPLTRATAGFGDSFDLRFKISARGHIGHAV